jgi:hypothetical protein
MREDDEPQTVPENSKIGAKMSSANDHLRRWRIRFALFISVTNGYLLPKLVQLLNSRCTISAASCKPFAKTSNG